jgi:hypothetical protein
MYNRLRKILNEGSDTYIVTGPDDYDWKKRTTGNDIKGKEYNSLSGAQNHAGKLEDDTGYIHTVHRVKDHGDHYKSHTSWEFNGGGMNKNGTYGIGNHPVIKNLQ